MIKSKSVNLAIGPGWQVDPKTGTLLNVALLTIGEAKGHGFYIDELTLATALDAIKASGGRLRVYPSHEHSGCTHYWSTDDADEVGAELNMAGFVQDVSTTATQLIGGRLEFFDAFKTSWPQVYASIAELALKTPDLCGLSLEPEYHVVWVGKDGTEYKAPPENVDLKYNGLPVARIDNLYAVAFGAVPAANPGLFAMLTSLFGDKQKNAGGVKRLLAELLRKDSETIQPSQSASMANGTVALPAISTTQTEIKPANLTATYMKIIADLRTKYGSDEKKFAQAMLIVGQSTTENLTLEQVESKMFHADLALATSTVADLTIKLAASDKALVDLKAAHATTLTALTAERDSFKTKFEAIKNSGLPGDLNLGAGADATGGENPWDAKTVNYTRQAELTIANPALAASLKAAATAGKK